MQLVLALLDAKDVRRALGAGEQVLAVVGVEEFGERLDAADDHHQVVLAGKRKHRVDQIVPRALLAELDLQTVAEKRKEIVAVHIGARLRENRQQWQYGSGCRE